MPVENPPQLKNYGTPPAHGIFASAWRTFDNIINFSPAGTVSRYWMNGVHNIHNETPDALKYQVTMTPEQLKAAQLEVYENFKNVTLVYAFHGSDQDLANNTAKFKLGDSERQYIGLQQDEHGKVTGYLDGSKVVGYLNDKTGARGVALLGKDGKITIALSGADLTTGTKADMLADMDDVFALTAGNMTSQFRPVYDFAKDVEQRFGAGCIKKIVGHSLGAHLATCLAPAFPEAKIYAYDCPGVTKGLVYHMANFYNKSEDEIRTFYKDHAGQMLQIDNGRNSLNTLGWMPREISMVDPAKDTYTPGPIKNLMPWGHLYGGGYYNAIQKLDPNVNPGQQKLFNMVHDKNDRANGPLYITAVELVGVGVVQKFVPLGTVINELGLVHGIIASHADNPKALPKLKVEHATHDSILHDSTQLGKIPKLIPFGQDVPTTFKL